MIGAYASHGDTKHIVLFPANPEECFTLAVAAFDLAERFQTPVFMLSDLDIGMNDWVCPRFKWDDAYRPDRGRVLSAAELEKHRPVPSLFERGRRPRRRAHAARRPRQGRVLHARLGPQQVRRLHRDPGRIPGGHGPPAAQAQGGGAGRPRARDPHADRRDASASSPWAAAIRRCARRSRLLAERGIVADYMRIRAFPFGETVEKFLAAHDRIFVVEQNRDAQLEVAADAGDRASQGEAAFDPGLRWIPAVEPRTWSTASPVSAGAELAHARRRNQRSPTRTCAPNKARAHAARLRGRACPRCARAAATIR